MPKKDVYDFKISFTEKELMDLINFVKISVGCGSFSPELDPCHRLALTVAQTYKKLLKIEKELI